MNATILVPMTQNTMTANLLRNRESLDARTLAAEEVGLCDCSEESMVARATATTLVLEEILSHKGFRHGGINE